MTADKWATTQALVPSKKGKTMNELNIAVSEMFIETFWCERQQQPLKQSVVVVVYIFALDLLFSIEWNTKHNTAKAQRM